MRLTKLERTSSSASPLFLKACRPFASLLFALFVVLLPSPEAYAARSVYILNTTDTHSASDPSQDSDVFRLSTLISESVSNLGGKKNVILIDCGDTLQGSLPASVSAGAFGLAFLTHNSFDVWVPGNHDFDFGLARFDELASKASDAGVSIIAANLKQRGVSSWKIFERNNIRVAVIGATLPYLESFNPGSSPLKDEPLGIIIDKLMPDVVRQKPDAVVLAIHHGVYAPKDRGGIDLAKIAERYPQINLFLGGHSHEENPGMKIGPASWFVQAGKHAKVLAEIELVFSDKDLKLLDIKSRLITVAPNTAADRKLKTEVKDFLSRAGSVSGIPLAEFKGGAEGSRFIDNFSGIVGMALCEASGAKIALSGFSASEAFYNGAVGRSFNYGELFKLIPYEDDVCTVELTPEQFKAVLAEQLASTDPKRRNMPWGASFTINENGSPASIRAADGSEWTAGRKTVALSSFAAAGGGGAFPVLASLSKSPECKLLRSDVKIRDAVAEFIAKNGSLLSRLTPLFGD